MIPTTKPPCAAIRTWRRWIPLDAALIFAKRRWVSRRLGQLIHRTTGLKGGLEARTEKIFSHNPQTRPLDRIDWCGIPAGPPEVKQTDTDGQSADDHCAEDHSSHHRQCPD